ncbi:MAG: hypothetical protein J6U54_09255, partial [Clostridiales bacterium]|nr:hypothetical protein [Clostridiales bacterium]
MIKRSSQRLLSVIVATTMALSTLAGFTDIVRADGDPVVKNIWVQVDEFGNPDLTTITLYDKSEDDSYALFGKFINNYEGYVASDEDNGLMILANDSSIISEDPNIYFQYRLSGDSSVTLYEMIASTNETFASYEGADDDLDNLLY